MRKLLSSVLAVTVLLGAAPLCLAQGEPKPLVTISFAGYDKLLADAAAIGQWGGNPNLGKQLEAMSAMMLPTGEGAKSPLALDTKKPWGAVLQGDGQAMSSYAFVPVTDIKPLVELAKKQSGGDIKADDGVYQIPINAKTYYASQKGSWAFLADSPDQLGKVATDPAPLLGDLPQRYTLAVRGSVKNLPKEYREQLLAQLRAGAEVGMQQMPGESDEDYAIRVNVAKQVVQQATTLVNELDDVLLGWNVDTKAKTTYLDLELTAQADTKLAAQFAEIKPGKTNFAGFKMPGAAVTLGSVGMLSDAQVAQAHSSLANLRKSVTKELDDQGLSKDEVKLAKQLLADVIDVVEKTIDGKKTNAGLVVLLDPAAVTVVGGSAIADGAKLENTIKQLVDEIKKGDAETAKMFKLGAETYEGVRFHVLTLPTPVQELAPMVGDTLEVVVGIADNKVMLAVGRDAAKTLKKVLDGSKAGADKEVPPLAIALAVTPIVKFIAKVGNDPQVQMAAAMAVGLLEKAGDKDHIAITATPIPQGVRVRLEVEEGILQVLGPMSQLMMPQMGGGADSK